MKRSFLGVAVWTGTMATVLVGPLVGRALAQGPRTIYLYNAALGAPVAGAPVAKTAPWGNGAIRNSRTMDYEGAPVLEITARNLQEGARFDLTTPIDIEPFQENGFMRMRLKFREAAAATAVPGEAGAMPGMPGMMGPGGAAPLNPPPRRGGGQIGNFLLRPTAANSKGAIAAPHWTGQAQIGALPPIGGGGPGGFPGLNEEGGAGAPGVPAGPPPQATPITVLQLTLVRQQGITSGRFAVNLETLPVDDNGWHLLVLPVRDMTSTPDASGPVSRVLLTADEEDTFFMAQTALVIENKVMTVAIRPANMPEGTQIAELDLKPGPINLIADVEAGAADPAIEWNFDADNAGNLPPAAFGGGPELVTAAPADNPAMAPVPQMGAVRPTAPRTPGAGPNAGAPAPTPPRRVPAGGPETVLAPAVPQFGPRIDARGLVASFTYPNEEQNYRIEVTVRDRSGQKPPVSASLLVRVRG